MRAGGAASLRTPWKAGPAGDEELDPASARPGRKKVSAAGVRAWLTVDAAGEARVVEAGRHSVMRRTGLPARDLRILDPQLSYPSTVLGRERAIVINLEHIKAIVTAHEVLLLNYRDSSVAPFVQELQRRLLLHHRHRHLHTANDSHQNGCYKEALLTVLGTKMSQEDGIGSNADWTNVYDLGEPRSRTVSPQGSDDLDYAGSLHAKPEADEKGKGQEAISNNRPRVLPFEFIALEACLESACSCLENEATSLEKEAHPALDKLTSKISTLNLERVRQIKSQLVAITGRVQKVRDELEQLLDDDEDMAEMYLTDKLTQQNLSNGSSHSSPYNCGDGMYHDRMHAASSSEENDVDNNHEDDSQNVDHDRSLSGPSIINGDSHGTHTFSIRSGSKHLDVEELEMLLEAYFIQIEGTLNKLSTLREYVDDTEDYINIMLDDKQNHLLQMGVMLTTATLVISAFVTLAGIFGMNIQVDLFDKKKSGMPEFLWTVGGGATGSVLLYVIAVAWCKHRRLLE